MSKKLLQVCDEVELNPTLGIWTNNQCCFSSEDSLDVRGQEEEREKMKQENEKKRIR